MNLLTKQVYGNKAVVGFNTYIGGVSATINTPALLATKLGISVGNISNFEVVGSDIKCKITGSYGIPSNSFGVFYTPCTYYIDSDYLVTSVADSAFYATPFGGICDFQNAISIGFQSFSPSNPGGGASKYLLKNATSIGNSCFAGCSNTDLIYIPNCTSLGTTSGNNNVFFNNDSPLKLGIKIYVNSSLATNNGGAPDGDLAWVIANRNADVRYVTNFTAPNPVTTLATGTVYNTAIQLNFTPPSSTNTIDYYECYANGVFKNNITASGEYVTGLTASTSYNITLIAVDIFYNKSAVSNTLTQSTANNSWDIATGLVSYYKLDANSNDNFGINNGTNTNITYTTGKIGNAAIFNGTSSLITVADSDSLSFNNATNDLPFSISYWINASNTQFSIINKSGGSTREYECEYGGGKLLFRLISNGNVANRLDQLYTISLGTSTWFHIAHTYNGSGSGGMKTYVNGSLVISTNTVIGSYTKMSNTTNALVMGGLNFFGSYFLNGKLDEVSIYNTALTQTQIDLIYNSGNGITL